jgi:hypothetical protein
MVNNFLTGAERPVLRGKSRIGQFEIGARARTAAGLDSRTGFTLE